MYKLYILSPLCGKIVKNEYIRNLLLNWWNSISFQKRHIYIYIYIYTYLLPHKENIFLWMNKILKNCPYVKSELLIRAYELSPKWTWLICPLIFPFINTRNAENGLASLRGVDLVMLVLSKVNPEVWLKHQLTSIRGFNPLC